MARPTNPWAVLSDEPDYTGAVGEFLEIVSGEIGTPEYLALALVPAISEDGKVIEEDHERAALIVRAVNCHDELLATLQAMVDEQVDYMTINKLGDPEQQHNVKRARAAIAKATP